MASRITLSAPLALLFLVTTPVRSVTADEGQVDVLLADGQRLSAAVDSHTSEHELWLRFGGGSVIVLRRIPWPQVDTVLQAGQALTREAVQRLATAAEVPALPPAAPRSVPAAEPAAPHDQRAREWLGFDERVTSVDVDASLANWDADVEQDGFLLRIAPRSDAGRMVPVHAVAKITVVARYNVRSHQAPSFRGAPLRTLAHTTVRLTADDFDAFGAPVRVPFPSDHPEFNRDWHRLALVHCELVVPGHGVFEHSQDGVAVRPFAPLRDSLQRDGARRFLPFEE